MRVLCLIDCLGSGGAQRQLTFLARQLKKLNIDVEVLTYYADNFFQQVLSEAGIDIETIRYTDRYTRAVTLRKSIRAKRFDVLLAFMDGPSLYAEIAALPYRRWGLVVSERSAIPGSTTGFGRLRRLMHCLADYVTTNSHTNRLMIEKAVPRLTNKVVTIYNSLDLSYFSPLEHPYHSEDGRLRFVVLASHQFLKNLLGLVEAAQRVLKAIPELNFVIEWYGGFAVGENGRVDMRPLEEARQRIELYRIQDYFIFHKPTSDVVGLYRQGDAIILPSFFEGLPNVVCEAMACGRPVLMSNVCDAENLVHDGENGFLFDPQNPDDMCRAMLRFLTLSPEERYLLGRKSRERAELLFNSDRFVAHYQHVLESAMRREHKIIPHWYSDTPQSATKTIESER
nr:glycosyltransferase family 4 protein [Syntrophus gentianae]